MSSYQQFSNTAGIDFSLYQYLNVVDPNQQIITLNDQNLITVNPESVVIKPQNIKNDDNPEYPLILAKVSNLTTSGLYDNEFTKISIDMLSQYISVNGTLTVPYNRVITRQDTGNFQWSTINTNMFQANTISGSILLSGSVTNEKIQSVSYSKITNVPTNLNQLASIEQTSQSGKVIMTDGSSFSLQNVNSFNISGSTYGISGQVLTTDGISGYSWQNTFRPNNLVSGLNTQTSIDINQLQYNSSSVTKYLRSVGSVNSYSEVSIADINLGAGNSGALMIHDNTTQYTSFLQKLPLSYLSGNPTSQNLFLKSQSGVQSYDQPQLTDIGTNSLIQSLNGMSSAGSTSIIVVSGSSTSYQPISSISVPWSNISGKPQIINDISTLGYSGAINGYVLTTSGSNLSWQPPSSTGSVNWSSISGIPSNISQLASLSGVSQDSVLKINSSGVETWQSISGLQVQYPLLQNKPTSLDNLNNVSGKNRQFYMVISGVGQYVDLSTYVSGYQNNLIKSTSISYSTPYSFCQTQGDGSWGVSNSFIKSSLVYTNVNQDSVQYLNNPNGYQCPVIFKAQSGGVIQEPIIYQNALDGIYIQQSGVFQTLNPNGQSYLPYISQSGITQTNLSGNGILSVQSGVIGFTSFTSNSMVTTSSSGSLTTMAGASGFVLLPYFQSDNTIQKRTIPAGQIVYSDGSSIQPLSLGASSNQRVLTYLSSNTISSIDLLGSSTGVLKGNGSVGEVNTIAVANTSPTTITYKQSLTNSSLLQGLEFKPPNGSVISMISQFGNDMFVIMNNVGTWNLWSANSATNVFASGLTYFQRGYYSTSTWLWTVVSDEAKKNIYNQDYKNEEQEILHEIANLRFRKWSYKDQIQEYHDYDGNLQPKQKRNISPCFQDLIQHKHFKRVCSYEKREPQPSCVYGEKTVDWTMYNILVSMAVKQLTKKVFKLENIIKTQENRIQRLERMMNIQEDYTITKKPRSQSPDSPEFIIIDKE